MTATTQLVRALARAAQPVTSEHKRQLFHRVQKLRNSAEQPHIDQRVRDEVTQLEEHLARVLSMEEELLRQQKDTATIRRQIHHAQSQDELNKKLDKIQFLLGELGARLSTQAHLKGQAEKRKKQLNKRIQRTTNNSAFQKQLIDIETKLKKKKKNIPPERLAAMQERLEKLKARVERKELIVPQMQPVKHQMLFHEQMPKVQDISMDFHSIDVPEMNAEPISSIESELPPPPARKRSLMKKLFGI